MRPPPLILIAAPAGTHPVLRDLSADEDYRTLAAHTGESALRALYEHRPDGMLLSLRLPGLDPWEVLRRVRAMCEVPVVVVDTVYRLPDAIRALRSGADDYLTPETPRELRKPVLEARLRRGGTGTDAPPRLADGRLVLDPGTHQAVLWGHPLELTPIEFALLSVLARNAGRVLSAERLLDTVWQVADEGDPSRVKYAVLRLRRKITETTGRDAPIETVRGVGYRYLAPEPTGR
ncbi:response regulator transcription factor [Streptomyces sp. DT171]|uniref:response regulator transcription factor n=1 Tax=Streptomyces sp. DT171 TaxID=3416524 RepID=UPI003CE73678